MPSLTRTQARDSLFRIVTTAVSASGLLVQIHYEDSVDREDQISGDPDESQLRVAVRHVASSQVTIGTPGNRSFRRWGALEMLAYTPKGDGLTQADALVTILTDALEGIETPEGVLLRTANAYENNPVGSYSVTRVSINFEYDQIK